MADLSNTEALYTARPSFRIDGQDNTNLTEGLLTLLVEETTAGLFRCEATFGNWGPVNGNVDFLYFNRQVLDFGKTLTVVMGQGETAAQIFEGRIMGLEAHYSQERPPEIVALIEDRFQDLRMTRRTRTFENVSDSDVMQQIASQHSLKKEIDVDGPTYPVLAQVNQSDLAFLRERARAIDAEVWVEKDTFYAQTRSRRATNKVTLTYGRGLQAFSVLADLANQRTSFSVSGWDVAAKEGLEYTATESAISGELNGFQSGSSVLQSAIGQRAERIVHMVPLTNQETQSLAEAHYRKMARRFITGHGLAEGDGRILVGTHVELKGLGTLFDGQYYVTEARHTFDLRNGYRTQFAVERPGLGQG
jgi:phage protein D